LVTADAFAEAGAAVTFPDVRGGKNMRSTTTPRKRGVGGLRAGRVLTTLLAVCWSVLWAGAPSAADATEQTVLAAHEKRRDATLAGDAAAVGSMMTDDLTFTHANAVVETKAEFLDARRPAGINTSRPPTRNAGCAFTATRESSRKRVASS
jgi:Domain of unknown function (DUF4440)